MWFKDHPNMQRVKPDPEYIYSNFQEMYEQGILVGSIVIHKGEVIGALLGVTGPDLYEDIISASEVLFYIEPKYRSLKLTRELFEQYEYLAKEDNVSRLVFGTSSGYRVDSMKKLYKYLGFVEHGGAFTKEI